MATAETRDDVVSGGSAGSSQTLIASDRVEGTAVRRANGETIGTIERLVIEKVSGRVVYAVMNFGGVLGVGEGSRTLPWSVLTYNTDLDAYELELADDQLNQAPHRLTEGSDPSFDREWEDHVHTYFNASPYWNEAVPRATEETRKP
ncbi:PRC-barrel domain-containing protein [uncultured Enterovirga sp.]|uniref:PRC-barrel domain-containing protein n=1 Tax=uncultured Enterovirga sp. TaxID=2026352 RepID=UPI0035CB555E